MSTKNKTAGPKPTNPIKQPGKNKGADFPEHEIISSLVLLFRKNHESMELEVGERI